MGFKYAYVSAERMAIAAAAAVNVPVAASPLVTIGRDCATGDADG